MKIRKLLCLVLCLAAVLTVVSCKEDDKPVTGNTNIDVDDEYTSHILKEDYEGYNFRILARKGLITDQYVEEETGDIVNDAVYRRNETVKSMLNINISATESSTNGSETDALNSILAGDDQYDLIFPHSRSAFTYAVQNTLVNFNDVETLHLDKPWWSKDIIDSCNVNGHLYVLDGDNVL